ncbi:MAG: alpha/beta fold hydrolase [Pseudomonadota bacterium]
MDTSIEYQSFRSDGVEIAFVDVPPEDTQPRGTVLLIHGFASNIQANWVDTSWFRTLGREGYRVVACDVRGHGRSAKLYDETLYGARIFAEDARRLLDHLEIPTAHVIGYSMGARITAFLAMTHAARVASATFGGLGANMVIGLPGARAIAHAFLADSLDEVTHPTARSFREFAEATGSDLKALAHCILSARAKISREMVAGIEVPVLVAVGTNDPIGGPAEDLALMIPGAVAAPLEGLDHMKAVGARAFKDAAVTFLATHTPAANS